MIFFVVLRFELMASYLLDRHSYTLDDSSSPKQIDVAAKRRKTYRKLQNLRIRKRNTCKYYSKERQNNVTNIRQNTSRQEVFLILSPSFLT
jgi:hypothetical protein